MTTSRVRRATRAGGGFGGGRLRQASYARIQGRSRRLRPSPKDSGQSPSSGGRDEGFAEKWNVQVDRTRRVSLRQPPRACRATAPGDGAAPVGLLAFALRSGVPISLGPAHRAAEHPLAGRSSGSHRSPGAPSGRSALSQDQERHRRMVRLEHRWVQVGDRGAGRRHDDRRDARKLGETEREEACGPLVDADVQIVQTVLRGRRPAARRPAARSASQGTAPHAARLAPDELVDEHSGERGRRVHASDCATHPLGGPLRLMGVRPRSIREVADHRLAVGVASRRTWRWLVPRQVAIEGSVEASTQAGGVDVETLES